MSQFSRPAQMSYHPYDFLVSSVAYGKYNEGMGDVTRAPIAPHPFLVSYAKPRNVSVVVGDFDEILVRVAEVDGGHWTARAVAGNRTFDNGDATGAQMLDDLSGRHRSDEAEIARSR